MRIILDISAIDLLKICNADQAMKEMYLSDLNDFYKRIAYKVLQVCHQHPPKFFSIVPNFG